MHMQLTQLQASVSHLQLLGGADRVATILSQVRGAEGEEKVRCAKSLLEQEHGLSKKWLQPYVRQSLHIEVICFPAFGRTSTQTSQTIVGFLTS